MVTILFFFSPDNVKKKGLISKLARSAPSEFMIKFLISELDITSIEIFGSCFAKLLMHSNPLSSVLLSTLKEFSFFVNIFVLIEIISIYLF